jgi:hypothetical protein
MRRPGDFYPTPQWATEELLRRESIQGNVLECCSGLGHITHPLKCGPLIEHVVTNDLNPSYPADYHLDVRKRDSWKAFPTVRWVVTNPPFNAAEQIVPLALEHTITGLAVLLRLSFLEPTYDRQDFLSKNPPTKLIVLPRISFTGNGKTDSVTCGWMIWLKNRPWESGSISIVEK